MGPKATSPTSSGPTGPHFEGQVGAHYLLTMLTGGEPRGLQGTIIDRVEFQRAAEGYPLDDIIVHAHYPNSEPAILEIQAKRSIKFSPADQVFRKVANQIVNSSRKFGFWNRRHELAIAIAKTSNKIDGSYQDVLTWARQVSSAAIFNERVKRAGSGSEDKRVFVNTFKSHLLEAGETDSEDLVWKFLRRVQILVFDFTSQNSASEELVKERAAHALHIEESSRAGSLWSCLIELTISIGTSGGDRDRATLTQDLEKQHFRLAGERRYSLARSAIAEQARQALAIINTQVDDVRLGRDERVSSVHAALDQGRYIEIRGDAGVGKSGILKHFAEQIAVESPVILLSPLRVTPRGWLKMRNVLGFDGSAHEFLSDLAADGSAILFIDNVELFSAEERVTVVDIVHAAVEVPGFAIVLTARRNFGVEEQSWLPTDALKRLGSPISIMVNELSGSEIAELQYFAPKLAALLADNHPAREVVRNLFRLARLASRPLDEPVPNSEAEMAKLWWTTADGTLEDGHRERARLLKQLAVQALTGTEPFDVSGFNSTAIDSLVKSQTLRDLGNDRVVFWHDVLRDWAVANLLCGDTTLLSQLPLLRPAPSKFGRSVELLARLTIENATDGASWAALLDTLSRDAAHGSWRRLALLALVRSEVSEKILVLSFVQLLANNGELIRELIRTVMSVDVEPASRLLASVGMDPALIPDSLNVPSAPSWGRLILWLLALGDRIPALAIPEVTDFYVNWSLGVLGADPLTPLIVPWLHKWLNEIEVARELQSVRDMRQPFGGKLEYRQVDKLEEDLRFGFVAFSIRAPNLAGKYLQAVGKRPHNDRVVQSIMKFRGTLAQAAPSDLADLTGNSLIPKEFAEKKRRARRLIEQPFEYIDHDFIPPSPAQGPFLELLTHAPSHGMSLIRRLVDHAIIFYRARGASSDSIIIQLPDGESVFPWAWSYGWSREGANLNGNCVTSGLMSLEAWAHKRLEAGEDFDKVLVDIIDGPNTPAAYSLVAVDLIISHWPNSAKAAIPFLGCPELLCYDLEREVHDKISHADYSKFKGILKEPAGPVKIESLHRRASRKMSLRMLLGWFAVYGPADLRSRLVKLLENASKRLGPMQGDSALDDPACMAAHALNRIDPNNWVQLPIGKPDGASEVYHDYVSPESEQKHFDRLTKISMEREKELNMQSAIGLALDDPTRASPEFLDAAVTWAKNAPAKQSNSDDETEKWMQEHAVYIAAMVAARDGDNLFRETHEKWAREFFDNAMRTKRDVAHRFRSGLRYNPVAMAFAGLVFLLRDRQHTKDIRVLLELAAREDPAAAHGFGAAASTLAAIDERLPRAVLRCAFAGRVQRRSELGTPEAEVATQPARHQQRVNTFIARELSWLNGEGSEPNWPIWPSVQPRRKRSFRLPIVDDDDIDDEELEVPKQYSYEYVDHQGAALWFGNAARLVDVTKRPWFRTLAQTYCAWTATANGAGLAAHDEIDNRPREWDEVYFDTLAHCMPGLTIPEIDELALNPLCALPDRPFFDVLPRFVRSIDAVYFNDRGILEGVASHIRLILARRLMVSAGWSRLSNDYSTSIEMHIGPAIAVLFFNDSDFAQAPKCYLFAKAIELLDAFKSVLIELIDSGPHVFTALVFLNLLEVSPRNSHLEFLVFAGKTWLNKFSDNVNFWVNHGIGKRICALMEQMRTVSPAEFSENLSIRIEIDFLLAGLVRLGVPEASRLEKVLATQ